MVIVNIVSILAYIVSFIYVRKGNTLASVWIMFLEVYLHVVFASVFMGMSCGYQLWLFGTFSSIFLPFFVPDLSIRQKVQIGTFCIVIVGSFMVLTALDSLHLLPTKYNVSPTVAHGMYYFNALLGFGSIMLYMGIYNARMYSRSRGFQLAADHDFLTGIYNRQRMQKILDKEINRLQELGTCNLSVAIADIDFFKNINDTYGHDVGDEALKLLTRIFTRNSDTGLLYGRWGGEEFLLIAPENMSYDDFIDMLEHIRQQVEGNGMSIEGKTIRFTVSIGAARYIAGMTSDNLVNAADENLYGAKKGGRNKVVY
ncbi:GGDEF domain-containing protein [Butyrivibrio sp. JL13D10]|uniref:GGDEF domain-containing protein n=1 Tax=Butyrivibrio sp. JL13D10 TaxID=3236815 RepID=UPI0038B598AA